MTSDEPTMNLLQEYFQTHQHDVLCERLTPAAIELLRPHAAEAIAIAAEWGQCETLKKLLAQGFPIDEYTETGTPLLRACADNVPEARALPVVKFLLSQGADPNTRLKNTRVKGRVAEETPLHLAARFGHPAIAECLLNAGADVFAVTRGTNNQPLHEALFGGVDGFTRGKEQVASLLLRHGANINAAMRSDGETPLTTACIWANEKVALFLLRNGANAQLGSKWRPNVLHEVMFYFNRWARVPNWSGVEDFPPNAPVMEVIGLILDAGADVNAVDSQGNTPLHLALRHPAYREAARLLLKRGANINALDSAGVTPLAVAIPSYDEDFVRELLAGGADPLAGAKGCSALEYVVHGNGEGKLKILLTALSPTALESWSETLLHAAAWYDAAGCISLMEPYGVKPGMIFTPARMSPLHIAARRDSLKLLEMCLQAGSDPDIRDRLGRSPLYMAARHNRPDAIKMLLRFGADASLPDRHNMTPLQIAQQKNKKRAIVALTARQ